MQRTRTFIDSGVLIAAFQGQSDIADNALKILDDENRDFITSDFVLLEVLPKPVYHKNDDERSFYEVFFNAVKRILRSSSSLVEEAQDEAEQVGLSAVDALHISAAKRARCDELV